MVSLPLRPFPAPSCFSLSPTNSYAFAILGVPLSIMLFRRALLNGTPATSRPRSRRNSKAHSIGEGGSPLPTAAGGGTNQLESHEMHNIAYSPTGTTSKDEYGSEEYAPAPMQAPRMTAYASSPTTSANSGAPFGALAPRPMVPTYAPSPSMPYQARAPAWAPTAPTSAGRGSVSSSTGLLGQGGGGGQQRSGSRQGLVPAAEPMAEAVPSFYAARSQYS